MTARNSRRRWTEQEIHKLEDLWDKWQGKPFAINRLAKKFGRSPKAMRNKALDLGLYRRPDGDSKLSATQAARLIGMSYSTIRQMWLRSELAHGRSDAHTTAYAVELDTLWDWMENPRTWTLWEPEQLPDLAWREHFGALRKGWLSAKEVARHLDCCVATVNNWRRWGWLPGMVTGNFSWYRIEDVERLARERGSVKGK